VLHADRLGEITLDSPVTYRGVQVGNVQDIRLSDVADSTNITVFIWEPYTVLVRTNSAFWSVKGADLKGDLLNGIKLNINSLRSILTGSITFATPDKPIGKQIPSDGYFILNDAPRDEWLTWKPKIPISPGENSPPPPGVVPNSGSPALPAPQGKH
jgi:paraquat-inducible protein B